MHIAVSRSLGSVGRWLFPEREFFWAKLVDKSMGGFWWSEGGTFPRNVGNRSPGTQRHTGTLGYTAVRTSELAGARTVRPVVGSFRFFTLGWT